jgi:hypothetical protein
MLLSKGNMLLSKGNMLHRRLLARPLHKIATSSSQ